MAWDACKIQTKATIEKKKEEGLTLKKALKMISKETDIPVGTLKRWYYDNKDKESREYRKTSEKQEDKSSENGNYPKDAENTKKKRETVTVPEDWLDDLGDDEEIEEPKQQSFSPKGMGAEEAFEEFGINVFDDEIKEETLRVLYHFFAKKYHPDKQEGDEEKMAKINEAYNCLKEKAEWQKN